MVTGIFSSSFDKMLRNGYRFDEDPHIVLLLYKLMILDTYFSFLYLEILVLVTKLDSEGSE